MQPTPQARPTLSHLRRQAPSCCRSHRRPPLDVQLYTHSEWNIEAETYDETHFFTIFIPDLANGGDAPQPPLKRRETTTTRAIEHVFGGVKGNLINVRRGRIHARVLCAGLSYH